MHSVKITLPSGLQKDFPAGITAEAILKDIQFPDRDSVMAVHLDGKAVDLSLPIERDAELDFITDGSEEGLEILRHSAAHVMAQAVLDLYPETKFAIGPAIENGFYYDFDVEDKFTPEDLEAIEERMSEIIRKNHPFERHEVTRKEALIMFKEKGETYKVELLEEIDLESVSYYTQGSFLDLCRGPHIPSTGKIKAFKITSVAGAYWRGDERNKMLQRIYGTAFESTERLDHHLKMIAEAKKRDHRLLGKQLDLFSIHEDVGAGLIIWHPRGAILRTLIEDFEKREHLKRGYLFVKGPTLLKTRLWERSGHWENYRQNMYFTEIEGENYGIKPMNCLAHMMVYRSATRSYRDLPLRYFELGTVHRHEKSGVLHGLPRVREFTQDDAHILCTPEQVTDEIKGVIDFVHDIMDIFDFPYSLEVSTRPHKSIGSDKDWERATKALFQALDENGLPYTINEGEGAFYGPKIDVKLRDALGREWQCATVQCDFTLPERFDLNFIGSDGLKHRPVMLHRVILGSLERFIGILIEHHAGAFPLWLSPIQVMVMTITDAHIPYAEKVYEALRDKELRVEKDLRNEKIGFKIREAQFDKVPYMIIVGDREVKEQILSVRSRKNGDIGSMSLEALVSKVTQEIENKS